MSNPSIPLSQKSEDLRSFELHLIRVTPEKRKHSLLLLEPLKAKKPRRDINPTDVIHISKEGNQTKEAK